MCDHRLSRWLQRHARDLVCRDPPTRGRHTGIICRGFPSPNRNWERLEFDIILPLGDPFLRLPRCHLQKPFPPWYASTRQRGFEVRVFPLLGELPKAIEHHLSVCQLYRWQLGPSKWSLPKSMSLDPIEIIALRVGFPGENIGTTTCGFVCNCPVLEAWTIEA